MQLTDLAGNHVARVTVPAQSTADGTNTWGLFIAPAAVVVKSIKLVPHAAVTGANANNFALAAKNIGAAGSGTTAITSTKTYASGTDSTLGVPEALTLSTTDTDTYLADGDVLALVRTVNGSGLASPSYTVEIAFQYR